MRRNCWLGSTSWYALAMGEAGRFGCSATVLASTPSLRGDAVGKPASMMTGGAVTGLRRAPEAACADFSGLRCSDGLIGNVEGPASGGLAAAKIKAPVATVDTQTMAAAMCLRCCERKNIASGRVGKRGGSLWFDVHREVAASRQGRSRTGSVRRRLHGHLARLQPSRSDHAEQHGGMP